ncbi:Rop guanine nucleotide exchange factor 9 [Zea mays]|uniref:Rop guanine nucleotide exchange factor 9 n=1 Tax=Zea mays TaxID=4577 RepID=A0A1D6NFW5_MAIZE|nr:Rop guanine nucleotide exchange factor 9 [Zea mays]
MKDKFAKLLLGEDMSGTGKGVSSALALSNAITNLAASIFGEQRRLEPMSAERRARWNKEIDWLLSVADHIVEFSPSQQVSEDGTNIEVMGTQQRGDLLVNIPALRKLDAMLLVSTTISYLSLQHTQSNIQMQCNGSGRVFLNSSRRFVFFSAAEQEYLDSFGEAQEFWYVAKDADGGEDDDDSTCDKWWIPTVRVPAEGLSDASRKWLQHQKDLVGQVLKAAMAINADVIAEMEIPEEYIESLPKVIDIPYDPGAARLPKFRSVDKERGKKCAAHLAERKVHSWRLHVQDHNRRRLRPQRAPAVRGPVDGAQDRGPQGPDRGLRRHLAPEDQQQALVGPRRRQPGEAGGVRGAGADRPAHPQAQVPRHPSVGARHQQDPVQHGRRVRHPGELLQDPREPSLRGSVSDRGRPPRRRRRLRPQAHQVQEAA